MEWKVFYFDINSDAIKTTDILNGGSCGFARELREHAKKCSDFASFEDEVRRSLMYYYWSKCEWEVLITPWVGSRKMPAMKVDVYTQIRNAWEPFVEYLWNHREELIASGD